MRKLLKQSMLFMVMQALLVGVSFSSDRVDYLLEEDSIQELKSIQEQLYQLEQLQFQLQKIELNIAKKANGEKVYLKIEKKAGALVLAGVVAGSASVYFPPGMRAMISAKITVDGVNSGMLKLSEKDAKRILGAIVTLRRKLTLSKKGLIKNSEYYCKFVTSHDMCP